ncbi:MAG: 6,7-dimethyl-8-ribityllumazine synthase [Planctomycetota bacterium]
MVIIEPSQLIECPKIYIVVSKFNPEITDRLLAGAIKVLKENDIPQDNYSVVYVTGVFEIPIITKHILIYKKPDGIIVIGAVIKGETEHYYFLSAAVLPKILELSLEFKIPITNSIIICENEQQALERAGGRVGNRGSEAATALLNSLSVLSKIKPL